MELLHHLIDLFLHLDKHLNDIIAQYGTLTYGILFAIIFVETGLVVMPFLPGDSLLFAAGALAATAGSPLNITYLFGCMLAAAVLGNMVNYTIGHFIGPRVFSSNSRLLNKEYLNKTHAFYEKYGGITIIITRFMPIIRTFAPFVAGVGAMKYPRFFLYNVIGGFLWVASFLFAGYYFGNIPSVKRNFTVVIFAIIIISVLPAIIGYFRHRRVSNPA